MVRPKSQKISFFSPAKPLGQLFQALDRRTKIKRRGPANNPLKDGPDLDQEMIPLPVLDIYDNSFPLTVSTASYRKRLDNKATNGKRRSASFAEDTCRFRVGEIVILNEEGLTIHIPAYPNQGIRRRSTRIK